MLSAVPLLAVRRSPSAARRERESATGAETGAETEVAAEVEVESGAGAESETGAEAESAAGAESGTGAEAGFEAETGTGTGTGTETESGIIRGVWGGLSMFEVAAVLGGVKGRPWAPFLAMLAPVAARWARVGHAWQSTIDTPQPWVPA